MYNCQQWNNKNNKSKKIMKNVYKIFIDFLFKIDKFNKIIINQNNKIMPIY